MMRWSLLLLIGSTLVALCDGENPARKGGSHQPVQTSECNNVPPHPFDLVLGRPTRTSVTVSVLCYRDTTGYIAYGTQRGNLDGRTPLHTFKGGEPVEIVLSGLRENTAYFYQFRPSGIDSGECAFHTARPPGGTFTFTVTADSHLDEHTDPLVYRRTLDDALTAAPDFHIDLGDTFMSEKHPDRTEAAGQYLAQRFYFGHLCRSAPLFLVLGNHDGESPRGGDTGADSLAVWSNLMRKRFFPNPVPDGFYTGDPSPHPQAGLLEDYYAWEWGDALFVVLDPFWFAHKQQGRGDLWSRTLGVEQYRWLKRTLESSRAKFKFVFIHHLVGGSGDQCRGGSEAAPFYEWGGLNADGSNGFPENRPGWTAPIHRLFIQNHVNIVFHGHDHIYAKQDLDGIVYQEVPQPGYAGDGRLPRQASEYGYVNGILLGSSGYMRVTVSPDSSIVKYIRTSPLNMESSGCGKPVVADTYKVGIASKPEKMEPKP